MPPDISERSLEDTNEATLTADPGVLAEHPVPYNLTLPGGYLPRPPSTYDPDLCLLPDDVIAFVIATQPTAWQTLHAPHSDATRRRFPRRLAWEMERNGPIDLPRQCATRCPDRLATVRRA